jgi:hypothetical protein
MMQKLNPASYCTRETILTAEHPPSNIAPFNYSVTSPLLTLQIFAQKLHVRNNFDSWLGIWEGETIQTKTFDDFVFFRNRGIFDL